jgi:membrane protease YdiL (CAAX protease family)
MENKRRLSEGLHKVLRHPLVRLVIEFAFLFAVILGLDTVAQLILSDSPNSFVLLVGKLIGMVIVLLAYIGVVRVIERRPVKELATKRAVPELGMGLLLGAIIFVITIGILALLGYYRVIGTNPWISVLPALVAAISAGVIEELWFRGIVFRNVEEWLNTWWALAISALIFGIVHMANPGATLWAGLAVAIEAGILLAAAYIYTRRLWLGIGMHIAWNFVQSGIFGVAVSGTEYGGLLSGTLSGPALLSGGEFGVEASIFTVLLSLLVSAVLLYKGHAAGRFKIHRKDQYRNSIAHWI